MEYAFPSLSYPTVVVHRKTLYSVRILLLAEIPAMLNIRPYAEFILAACLVLLVYTLLHGIYRYNNIDDSWTLSYSYNYCQAGTTQDWRIGGESISMNNPGGLLSFGRVASWVQCGFLDKVGWSRQNGHLLSSLFTLLSVGLWFLIARKLKLSVALALTFCISLLLYEPIFQLANQSRSDFFAMFLVSAALYSWLSRFYVVAGLLSLMAIETHPLGVMAGVYIAAMECVAWRSWTLQSLTQKIGLFVLGALPVLSAYVLIYNDEIHFLFKLLSQYQDKSLRSFFLTYFLHASGYEYRHLPELAIFLFAAFIFFKKRLFETNPVPVMLLGFVILASFLLKRDNVHYMIYAAPPLLLLSLLSFETLVGRKFYLALFLLYFTPQYLYIFYTNQNNRLEVLDEKLQHAVPKNADIIFGDANSWITFKDRNFYHLKNIRLDYVHLEKYKNIYAISRDTVSNCGFPESKGCLEARGYLRKIPLQFEMTEQFQWGNEHYSIYRVRLATSGVASLNNLLTANEVTSPLRLRQ